MCELGRLASLGGPDLPGRRHVDDLLGQRLEVGGTGEVPGISTRTFLALREPVCRTPTLSCRARVCGAS
jgi:hypothetical protein